MFRRKSKILDNLTHDDVKLVLRILRAEILRTERRNHAAASVESPTDLYAETPQIEQLRNLFAKFLSAAVRRR